MNTPQKPTSLNIAPSPNLSRHRLLTAVVAFGCVILFFLLLGFGAVNLTLQQIARIFTNQADEMVRLIVVEMRLPMACAAFLSGMGLAVAGLLLQTAFNNPLAGPSILGVSTGASLGVAIVMLGLGGGAVAGISYYTGALFGAFVGSAIMLLLILLFSRTVKGTAMLLIVGILLGYLASSAISILNFYATAEGVHSYVIWGLGSFSGVTLTDLSVFGGVILPVVACSLLMIKPLNALLLGDEYAESMGVNVRSARRQLLLLAGVLTAAVTAFCGPIGFLGLVVPHVARMSIATSNHARLLPSTALWGGFAGLLTAAICVFAGGGNMLPVNAITPILSVPVIIYVIVNRNKLSYFR